MCKDMKLQHAPTVTFLTKETSSLLYHFYLCSKSPCLSHGRTEQPFFAKIYFPNTCSYRMCSAPQAP